MVAHPDQQVRLLGPVDLRVGPVEKPIVGVRRKGLLAMLALCVDQSVSAEKLIDVIWSVDAPATAGNTLQSHVSYLRGLFHTRDAITRSGLGYQLKLAGDATDLRLFERLVTQAGQANRVEDRVEVLRNALGLWRSSALADLVAIPWFERQAERIERLRASALAALVEARLELGQHDRLVPELESLVESHVFDEAAHAQLMLALYRSGRQADALAVYRRIRQRLLDELGVDPGQRLRDLETAVLRHDPSLDLKVTSAVRTSVGGHDVRPAHLPRALPHLTGRQAELGLLDEVVEPGGDGAATVAVSGPPGVGKTSLVVAWAHRVAPDFPDGQLFVDLHGFGPQSTVMGPAEVLHGFLEALGVPAQRIPESLAARVGLYRSLLVGRRVLVVLDNARDAEQVRPLLPGSPGCVVVVTSRNRLTSLVATEGALVVPVDVLPHDEAQDFLVRRLGRKRVASEPDAVDDIVGLCAGLPLALAVVAARAATEPTLSLATLVTGMRARTGALDTLSGGDHSADVRAVISWSYAALDTELARLFRMVALNADVDFAAPAVASLAAISTARAKLLLTELATVNLVIALDHERYTMHDLMRAFAVEQSQRSDSDADRAEALHRLLDHYLHTGHAAAIALVPQRVPIALEPARGGVTVDGPTTYAEAMSWFLAESRTLAALVQRAYAEGADAHAWRLAWTMTTFHYRRGYWDEELAVHQVALAAATRAEDPLGKAHALRGMAFVHSARGRDRQAAEDLRQAIECFAAAGQLAEQARAHLNLAGVMSRQGQWDSALRNGERGLDLYRGQDDAWGVAVSLNAIGFYQARLGRFAEALDNCRRGLRELEELGDHDGLAATLDSLGYIHHRLGDHCAAIDAYSRAATTYGAHGNRSQEAVALSGLGDVYRDLGDPDRARDAWRSALEVLDELQDTLADEVRAKLATIR